MKKNLEPNLEQNEPNLEQNEPNLNDLGDKIEKAIQQKKDKYYNEQRKKQEQKIEKQAEIQEIKNENSKIWRGFIMFFGFVFFGVFAWFLKEKISKNTLKSDEVSQMSDEKNRYSSDTNLNKFNNFADRYERVFY